MELPISVQARKDSTDTILLNKNCKTCQKCCTGDNAPSVSWNELLALPNARAKYIGDSLYKLQSPCQYHSPDVGCTLGDKKPLACKLYPFFPTGAITSNKKEPENWVVKMSCPFWASFTNEDLEEAKTTLEKNKKEFMLFQ